MPTVSTPSNQAGSTAAASETVGLRAGGPGDLDQPDRVGGVGGPDDQDQLAFAGPGP